MASAARRFLIARQFCVYIGEYGRGTGRGGPFGGTIRSAGGAFSRLEAAREGEYFLHLQEEQVKEMKEHNHEEETPKSSSGEKGGSEKLNKIAAEQRAKLSKTPQVE